MCVRVYELNSRRFCINNIIIELEKQIRRGYGDHGMLSFLSPTKTKQTQLLFSYIYLAHRKLNNYYCINKYDMRAMCALVAEDKLTA